MRKFTYIAAAAIAASGFGLLGCEDTDLSRNDQADTTADVRRDTTVDTDTRTAGERVEDAAETAGEKIESGAEKTGEAIKDGADAAGDAARDAADSARTAAERATADNNAADTAATTPPTGDTGMAGDGAVVDTGSTAADRNDAAAADGRDTTLAPDGTAAAPDAEGIRDVLASSTEASLTKGGFDDLVERFVDADRNRIGDFAEQDMAELDGLVAEIQERWKAKYNSDFDIENDELVFNESYQIQQGEIGDARLAGEQRGVDVDVNREADGTGVDVNVQNNTGVDAPGSTDADKNLNDPGRNIATVTVPESHGLPQLTLNLIHELPDAWRIDIPDSVDGARLQQNLKDHLTAVKDAAATWPADENEAYRLVSHHIFMAVTDQPMSGANTGM